MMKMIVEQIVEVSPAKRTVKKVRLAELQVDILPIGEGDDLWFVDRDEKNRRSRTTCVAIRMGVSETQVYAFVDVIAPDLLKQYHHKGTELFSAKYVTAYIGDKEEPAPDAVEVT